MRNALPLKFFKVITNLSKKIKMLIIASKLDSG